jgi:hypothetical protein
MNLIYYYIDLLLLNNSGSNVVNFGVRDIFNIRRTFSFLSSSF